MDIDCSASRPSVRPASHAGSSGEREVSDRSADHDRQMQISPGTICRHSYRQRSHSDAQAAGPHPGSCSASGVGMGQVNPSRPLKVALLLPGPITDGTFCSAADKGIKAAEQKFPNIKVTMQENISFCPIGRGDARLCPRWLRRRDRPWVPVRRAGYEVAQGISQDLVHRQYRKGSRRTQPRVVR